MAKTERYEIRLTPELKDKLKKCAEAEHRTMANYIVKILMEYFEKSGK